MALSLRVQRLKLNNFRSYTSFDLAPEAPVVVLIGPNGAGKTNVLEAISLLTPGRGLRRATLAELAFTGQEPSDWAINAQIDGILGPASIGTGVQSGRRVVRVDSETASGPGVLGQHFSALWLTPTMDRLFIEGASGRRRFFDRMVFGLIPEHGRHASAYEKALRDRSQLLKDRSGDTDWLDTLEQQMAHHGTCVAQGRLDTQRQLQQMIDTHAHSGFPAATLHVTGHLEDALSKEGSADDVSAQFQDTLKRHRARDSETGGATQGPHKSDLLVHHAQTGQVAQMCSTGEQKALLITLVLSNTRCQIAKRNMVPVLLLDEVAAHLDQDRRAALFAHVRDLGGQVWLTGTDRSFFTALEAHAAFYNVSESAIVF